MDLTAAPSEIPLLASDPRSLAVSLDGSTVYVTILDSQNKTTVVPIEDVENGGGLPAPSIPMDPELPPAPVTSLIVRHNGTNWVDETGTSWDSVLGYELYDNDVIEIDVASMSVSATRQDVGAVLFNVAVNPVTGALIVTNTSATNEIRFEPVLQGQFVQNRITIIDPGTGSVTPVHLNSHINYSSSSGNPVERSQSLSFPTDVVISGDGLTTYVAAFGSRKVGVLNAAGAVTRRIPVGEGPSGLALDEVDDRLFVMNRHSSSISVVDLSDDSSVELTLGYDPTPANIRDGRILFYDGENSSAHGDISCASCHVYGGADNIAWDLGSPVGAFQEPPDPEPGDVLEGFHPMKGPMTTQTVSGLSGTVPYHWRGDKPELVDFNGAFVGLQGRSAVLSGSEFQLFEDFVFSIQLPPNPNRLIDDSLPAATTEGDPEIGETFFFTPVASGGGGCSDCHANASGNNSRVVPVALIQAISNQEMTVPQLRTLYEKTGFDREAALTVRGFGSSHNGAFASLMPHQGQLGGGERSVTPNITKPPRGVLRCVGHGTRSRGRGTGHDGRQERGCGDCTTEYDRRGG